MPRWGVLLVVAVAALLAHARAKGGEFVFHDDDRYVVDNPEVDRVGNPLRFFTDPGTLAQKPTRDIYRPVRTLSFAVITAAWGKESAGPFHLLAILLHVGTAVLLAALLLRAGLGSFASAAGALFFALHPLTVEVTAWVCSLGDAWCGLFAVASVLAYAADRRVLALLALALALFSKEAAVVVPGLWLAWDAFLRPERLRTGAWPRTLLLGAAPAGAVVVGFLLFRAGVAGARMSQLDAPLGGSLWRACCTMAAGFGWYAATILFPYGPTFDAVVTVRDTPFEPGALLGLLALGALGWALLRGPARVRLGAAWFLLALVPVHNVLVPLKIPTADRFLYLPLMGLSFAIGELAQRTYPFAAKWMIPALVLLGVLAVARTGDWKDDDALLGAGWRVTPKSRRLLWEEAGVAARKTQEYLLVGDDAAAERMAAQALAGYERFLRNSSSIEQTQVFVELGDLLYMIGRGRARYAPQNRRAAESRALEAYLHARRLQREGIGDTSEERHVAGQIVVLAKVLAEPQNPDLGRTIEAGLEAADFLKRTHGVDDTGARIVFRLADSVRVRGQEPEKARAGLDWVLEAIGRLEQQGADLPFLRAQALFYRAILRDQAFDRGNLELAARIYLEAADKDRSNRLRALAYAGRCACTIGKLFQDAEWTERGKQCLASIPAVAARDRLRLDDELANEIATIESGCGQ